MQKCRRALQSLPEYVCVNNRTMGLEPWSFLCASERKNKICSPEVRILPERPDARSRCIHKHRDTIGGMYRAIQLRKGEHQTGQPPKHPLLHDARAARPYAAQLEISASKLPAPSAPHPARARPTVPCLTCPPALAMSGDFAYTHPLSMLLPSLLPPLVSCPSIILPSSAHSSVRWTHPICHKMAAASFRARGERGE